MTSTSPKAVARAWVEVRRALVALAVALLVAFLLILATSQTPFQTFATLLTGPLGTKRTLGLWIDDMAKLTMTGLAFSLVFQARQFSMGVQGQVYMGGLAAALVALSPLGTSAIAMPLALIAAICAGGIWGFIPGYAKARLGANEIVSSLMLNYIAVNLVTYIVRVPLAAGPGMLYSAPFPQAVLLPALVARTRIDMGLILSLATVLLCWFALYRTSWGLKLRLVGSNAHFAKWSGIRPTAIMVSAMTASGMIGGLLGAMFVQGSAYGKLVVQFEGQLAFEGILVAIVARARPLAVPVVALFYGYLRQGGALIGLRTDVPAELISVVQAIIILLMASTLSLPARGFWARLRKAPALSSEARS